MKKAITWITVLGLTFSLAACGKEAKSTVAGMVITRYLGEEEAIRIPAEIDGDPVKVVSGIYNKSIIAIELPDRGSQSASASQK